MSRRCGVRKMLDFGQFRLRPAGRSRNWPKSKLAEIDRARPFGLLLRQQRILLRPVSLCGWEVRDRLIVLWDLVFLAAQNATISASSAPYAGSSQSLTRMSLAGPRVAVVVLCDSGGCVFNLEEGFEANLRLGGDPEVSRHCDDALLIERVVGRACERVQITSWLVSIHLPLRTLVTKRCGCLAGRDVRKECWKWVSGGAHEKASVSH